MSSQGRRTGIRMPVPAAVLLLGLAACTRTSVPVGSTPGLAVPEAPLSPLTTGIPFGFGQPTEIIYAVAWVGEGEELALRDPAGISGTVLTSFQPDKVGVQLTGNATFLGSSLWVQVESPAGAGWVNSWNLTEYIAPNDFCNDPRVVPLMQAFIQAVISQDGAALQAVANPKRGLVLRYDWWNPEVVIDYQALPGLFADRTVHEWGARDSMGSPIEGTFSEVILPPLAQVLQGAPTVTCGSLITGSTARPARWPSEYVNLNYYAFYRRDATSETGFNWRAWALGFEYLEGQPFLTLVVQYRGEV